MHTQLLEEIKAALAQVHGERLRDVVLYGSEARGDAREESDIDLLVILDGPIAYARDLQKNLDALFPLALRLGRRISPKPVDAEDYEMAACPLYAVAEREGVHL